jgi:hypothetical protein
MRHTMPGKIAARVTLAIHQRKRPNKIAPARGWAAASIVRDAIKSDENSCRHAKSTVTHKKRGVVLLRSQHSVDHGQDYRRC